MSAADEAPEGQDNMAVTSPSFLVTSLDTMTIVIRGWNALAVNIACPVYLQHTGDSPMYAPLTLTPPESTRVGTGHT